MLNETMYESFRLLIVIKFVFQHNQLSNLFKKNPSCEHSVNTNFHAYIKFKERIHIIIAKCISHHILSPFESSKSDNGVILLILLSIYFHAFLKNWENMGHMLRKMIHLEKSNFPVYWNPISK